MTQESTRLSQQPRCHLPWLWLWGLGEQSYIQPYLWNQSLNMLPLSFSLSLRRSEMVTTGVLRTSSGKPSTATILTRSLNCRLEKTLNYLGTKSNSLFSLKEPAPLFAWNWVSLFSRNPLFILFLWCTIIYNLHLFAYLQNVSNLSHERKR